MRLQRLLPPRDFMIYFCVGALATLMDWTSFSLLTLRFDIHYETALVLAYLTGASAHYTLNKWLTFQCRSKQLGSQLSLYLTLTSLSLLISMGIIAIFVRGFHLNPILARIMTTGFMVFPNYLLHKYITFSKRIFI